MAERYWLDETDPRELYRRAEDLSSSGHFGLACQLKARAHEIAELQTRSVTHDGMPGVVR
jgi:hypothetical protein